VIRKEKLNTATLFGSSPEHAKLQEHSAARKVSFYPRQISNDRTVSIARKEKATVTADQMLTKRQLSPISPSTDTRSTKSLYGPEVFEESQLDEKLSLADVESIHTTAERIARKYVGSEAASLESTKEWEAIAVTIDSDATLL
jgi:hypothetical protein